MFKMLALALCAVLALAHVSAQHPLSNLPPPGLVTTGSFFPEHPTKQFVAGKEVKCVLGIHNDASEAYNITAILGSLNSPADFRLYVQNFTENVFHSDLPAGAETSVEYTFMPDPRLEPRDFVVALTVVYHDNKGSYFSNTFFNSTVEIVGEKKLVDWELIQLFVMLGGLAAGALYLAFTFAEPYLGAIGIKSKRRSRKVDTSTPDDADEWVKGSHYDNLKKRKAASKRA